ncbi:MAG: radical SAM protein [Candidatus Omnitrophota bacterium]
MPTKKILLVYPKLGMPGSLVRHLPLSLLHAAVDSIKRGFEVDIADIRLFPDSWHKVLKEKINSDTFLVGLSVMTGAPIKNALEISRWIKKTFPKIKIVWGGPHATFNGRDIMSEDSVDYVIAGYGSESLSLLAEHLSSPRYELQFESIPGLIFRKDNFIIENSLKPQFENIYYKDIPYFLIESDLDKYGQLDKKERIFSIYSSLGCPYNCSFCSSPAFYKMIQKKYELLPVNDVVDHIEFVKKQYKATYIYFIDDDSFVSSFHIESIIDEINQRKLDIKIGFRGARINEIGSMSDEFLNKLSKAGTNIMHVGAESGSQKILDLIDKNITVKDILNANKKIARQPLIKVAYNWIIGFPGEGLEDLRHTQKLMLQIVKDNPNAIIFMPNKFHPLPGTRLFDVALKYGYQRPSKLEGWIDMEMESDYRPPWLASGIANMINMMQVASFFIDDKLFKINTGNSLRFKLLRFLARLYGPFAKLRMKYGISEFLFEYKIFNWYASRFRI